MASKSAYSGWKLAWMPHHLERLRAGKLCSPAHVQLHLTGKCNLKCKWCTYNGAVPRLSRPGSRIKSDDAVKFLLDFFSTGGRAVEFTGGGEPSCHPRHLDILRFALSLGLDVSFITNGLVPHPAHLIQIVPQFKWLRISLDASTPEEFKDRKCVDGFDKVVAFATLAARAAKRNGSCRVGISYLIDENTGTAELHRAVGIAKETGVHSIRFAPIYKESEPTRIAEATQAELKSLEVEDFLVINMTEQRLEDIEAAKKHPCKKCGYMMTSLVVGCDSKIYPCCFQVYAEDQVIGDLSAERFKSWWFSDRRRKLVNGWRRNLRCDGVACWHREKNDLYYKLVEEEPDDLFFI
jgi:MoaA/NifB/PqqE/SkfB family radical SAM enzyme